MEVYTNEEYIQILSYLYNAAISKRNKAISILAIETGMRAIDIPVKQFLAYKRGIGYQYLTAERYLNGFTKYMKEKTPETVLPDKDIILGYLDTKKQVSGPLYGTIAVLREFSRYLINQGYEEIYVIPPKRTPQLCPEQPYFFYTRGNRTIL